MRKALFIFLVVSVLLIGFLHFFTPGHLVFYHNTYRRLSYFPITIGAIWFGVKGGVFLALLTSIAFIPHILLFIGQGPEAYFSELTEIVLYIAAGIVVGIISGRESRLREKYKKLSEKLKRSYDRLQEQSELLIDAEEQLGTSRKLSVLGRLSASLAHEIKNPLGSIRGTAEILLDEFPDDHPKHEFVAILLEEVSRLNSSVDDVLQYCRGQKPEKTTQLEPLSKVIEHVSNLIGNNLNEKSITLIIEDMNSIGAFPVDAKRLSTVFLNIILNSIDAIPEKGEIRITFLEKETGILIQISDNGKGVPSRDHEKVFEPFFTSKDEGTGLGLAISKIIVESYGGSIYISDKSDTGYISDKSGPGACFNIYLPDSDENSHNSLIIPKEK
ncbi:MAG: GHKL domain-containing protein [Desulfobacterales bacterium]|jgi:signal transduction histidine kinase|nr:GHKL domain-containing protein [Desulfobacteraceae bacterium]MBT7087130.1 GHKL domain-containing protein [Desulfobacterales bacterium]MBT7696964.1 GHKL domain-containing protein [Desulfobacterales bacterium]